MFGKIRHKTQKGFAFVRQQKIADNEPIQDAFLHWSEFRGDWKSLQTGDSVEFTPGLKDGRPQAFDAQLVSNGGAR